MRVRHNHGVRASLSQTECAPNHGWFLAGLILLLCAAGCSSVRQGDEGIRVYPDHFYSGENILSVSAPAGIESIRVLFGDSAMYRSTILSDVGKIDSCATAHDLSFDSDTAGDFRIPVITWMKRSQTNGDLLSYPIADTAVIRVRKPE